MIATLILIVLLILYVLVSFIKNGEPKGDWNFYITFICTLIVFILFYCAGLFDKFLNN